MLSEKINISGITNILKPSIDLKPIEFNIENTDPKVSFDIGYRPFVWFNDLQIDVINSFAMKSSGLVPTLTFNFTDSYGQLGNTKFPNDDSRIRVFINPRSEILKPVYMEFKVIDFNRLADNTYNVTGIANINGLYLKKYQSYPSSTSYECLLEFCKRTGMGFSTNVSGTDDNMTWINPACMGKEFIENVVKHSYRGDSSFMWAYIDFYYNLVYVDVEQQMKEDISNQLGITDGNIGNILNNIGSKADEEVDILYITNDKSAEHGNNYYTEWSVYNQSTKMTLESGYIHRMVSYDNQEKNLLTFDIDSIGTEKNNIRSLKYSEDKEFSEYAKWTYTGRKINSNVHSNYDYAVVQNKHNIVNLQKISMEVILNTPNFNFYRFQKIYNLMVNTGIETELTPLTIQKLSGEWIITEIIYFIDGENFKQKLKLARRDLNLSQDEL